MCIIVMGGLVARRQVRKFHNNDVLRQRREAKVLGGLGSAHNPVEEFRAVALAWKDAKISTRRSGTRYSAVECAVGKLKS